MDTSLPSTQQRKPTKKPKPSKKKPIKVKYISNPMKVETSASQFRALVQELTGQDAEFPADPTKLVAASHVVVPPAAVGKSGEGHSYQVDDPVDDNDRAPDGGLDRALDGDDIFVPDQRMDNSSFPGLFSGGWINEYCSQVDLLRGIK